MLKAFYNKGHDVHVVAPGLTKGSEIRKALEALGFYSHNIILNRRKISPFIDLLTIINLLFLFYRFSPKIIFSYTIKPVIYSSIASRFFRFADFYALITGLGYTFQNSQHKNFPQYLAQLLYALGLKSAKKVFFQNPDDRDLFKAKGFLLPRTPAIVVNGSGVNLDRFKVAPYPSKITFLLLGRLIEAKGIKEFVEAACILESSCPNVRFQLAGNFEEGVDSISKYQIESWQRDTCVEYLGNLQDVRPALAETSVYVLPSWREGTPRTVLEAMAMGRPIITTDVPGCRETVKDGHNGFLVPIRNPRLLAEAMRKFFDNPELIEIMGRRSRLIAEQKYDVHKVNQVFLNKMDLA